MAKNISPSTKHRHSSPQANGNATTCQPTNETSIISNYIFFSLCSIPINWFPVFLFHSLPLMWHLLLGELPTNNYTISSCLQVAFVGKCRTTNCSNCVTFETIIIRREHCPPLSCGIAGSTICDKRRKVSWDLLFWLKVKRFNSV